MVPYLFYHLYILYIIISTYFRFASWSPSTTTDNPFKYKINSGKETSFPVIEVNGPPIKLPSFSVSSNFKVFSENDKENKMQMYSDIEQRTGSSRWFSVTRFDYNEA